MERSAISGGARREYRYRLGKRVGICPQCGQRKFKYYIDTATGDIVDERCGRCNRQNNCGYHATPKEFVKGRGFSSKALQSPPRRQPLRLKPNYMTAYTINPWAYQRNNLYRYLCAQFGDDTVSSVFHIYSVSHSIMWGNATEFPLIDRDGKVRSIKVIGYRPDGHRMKSESGASVYFKHCELKRGGFNYVSCFFGENIASATPQRKVVIVESEKTALILMCFFIINHIDDYVAVATGGCGQLNVSDAMMDDHCYKLSFVKGRDVVLIPDADSIYDWAAKGVKLLPWCKSVRCVNVLQSPFKLSGSEDIGDLLMGKPERWPMIVDYFSSKKS